MNSVSRPHPEGRWRIWKLLLLGGLAVYLPPLGYYEYAWRRGSQPHEVSFATGHGPWFCGPEVNFASAFLLAQGLLLLSHGGGFLGSDPRAGPGTGSGTWALARGAGARGTA